MSVFMIVYVRCAVIFEGTCMMLALLFCCSFACCHLSRYSVFFCCYGIQVLSSQYVGTVPIFLVLSFVCCNGVQVLSSQDVGTVPILFGSVVRMLSSQWVRILRVLPVNCSSLQSGKRRTRRSKSRPTRSWPTPSLRRTAASSSSRTSGRGSGR